MEVKRRWMWGFAGFGIFVLLVGLWVAWQAALIPRYEWRTMNSWFRETSNHTNLFRYLDSVSGATMRDGMGAPRPDFKDFPSPGVNAFRQFGEAGTEFLIANLAGSTNWIERDARLRKWLPKFSHKWLPTPPKLADQKKTALYLLSQLGTNANAHEAIYEVILRHPNDEDFDNPMGKQDVRVHVLAATGGPTEMTMTRLLQLSALKGWGAVSFWLQDPELLPVFQNNLARVLAVAKTAPKQLHDFANLFQSLAPSQPETLDFYEFALRRHRFSRSVTPLVSLRPDNQELVNHLFTLIELGDPRQNPRSGRVFTNAYTKLPYDRATAVKGLLNLAATRREEIVGRITPLLTNRNELILVSGIRLARGVYEGSTNLGVVEDLTRRIRPLALKRSSLVETEVAEFLWQVRGEPGLKIRLIVDSMTGARYFGGGGQMRFLTKLEAGQPDALAGLIEIATHAESNGYRVAATSMLAAHKDAARDALEKLSRDRNPNVRSAAERALKKITPP